MKEKASRVTLVSCLKPLSAYASLSTAAQQARKTKAKFLETCRQKCHHYGFIFVLFLFRNLLREKHHQDFCGRALAYRALSSLAGF